MWLALTRAVEGGRTAMPVPDTSQALSLLPTRSLANIPIMGAAFMPPVRCARCPSGAAALAPAARPVTLL